MGSSVLSPASHGTRDQAVSSSLVKLQSMVRDFAESRKTPFGTVIPKISVPVFAYGAVQVPAYGTQALIATYQVKAGWVCVLCGIVLQFAGTGPAPNPTDVLYSVDIDRALGATEGYTEKDFGAVPFTLGNFNQLVWPCEFRHNNGEAIRIKATAVANMGFGPGNFFYGALVGFEWPEQGYEAF